jgi:hypothetical protein
MLALRGGTRMLERYFRKHKNAPDETEGIPFRVCDLPHPTLVEIAQNISERVPGFSVLYIYDQLCTMKKNIIHGDELKIKFTRTASSVYSDGKLFHVKIPQE